MLQNHSVKVKQGQNVSVAHHKADSNNWSFFCHGFGSNKQGSYEKRCEIMAKNGWNAVRFDFRGNGESDGNFINQNLSSRIADLKAVIDYFDPEECAVFGSSFGGKVAFHAAEQDNRIKALIGKAPVTYKDIMHKFRIVVENKGEFEYIDGKPIDQRFFDDFDKYSFDQTAESLNIPVAIFHGSEDTTVHIEKSFEAIKELETDVSFHKLKNEKHSFTEEGEEKMMAEMA